MKNGLYLHINNGGIKIEVSDDVGPTINISASHFGHQTNEMRIHVEKETLREIGQMFRDAYDNDFSEASVVAAKIEKKDTDKKDSTSDNIEYTRRSSYIDQNKEDDGGG